MSLYADYVGERLGWETIEVESGFITYDLKPPVCAIEEFYVKPDQRGTTLAKRLADSVFKIAKDAGCTRMLASVTAGIKGSEHALKTNLHYGFKLLTNDGQRIILYKEIE